MIGRSAASMEAGTPSPRTEQRPSLTGTTTTGWNGSRRTSGGSRIRSSATDAHETTTRRSRPSSRPSARADPDGHAEPHYATGRSRSSDRLLEAIPPDHPTNPFTDQRAAARNELAVQMLLRLGIRRGELLALKISDIHWQTRTLSITRRPNDPEDPRTPQPTAKTLARDLPLSPELAGRINQYIRGARRQTKRAQSHRFLLVVHRKGPHEGEPLSEPGLTKVFTTLRRCDPLLAPLHPHVLRHTWNWKFSDAMDALPPDEAPSEAKEEQVRGHLMGWIPGSASAKFYNRRHIAKKAHKATRLMHERIQSTRAKATSDA